MSIKPSTRRAVQGMTLIELMIAMGIFSVVSMALMTIFIFSLRSFETMSNYANLDRDNRLAMAMITRDVRQASYVANYVADPPTLTLVSGSEKISYLYDEKAQTLTRSSSDEGDKVLLERCSELKFNLFQRNAVGGSYDVFPVAKGSWTNTAKVVELSWKTNRRLKGTSRINSEYMETARIVIRKQSD
jgi:prepilin-type N-terminal cleavage/methylation domain-containing protein